MLYHEPCRGQINMTMEEVITTKLECPHCHAQLYAKNMIPTQLFADSISLISVENQSVLKLIVNALSGMDLPERKRSR